MKLLDGSFVVGGGSDSLPIMVGARLFLSAGASLFRSTNPPGGWGGILRSYGYKHCIGKFYGYKPYGQTVRNGSKTCF